MHHNELQTPQVRVFRIPTFVIFCCDIYIYSSTWYFSILNNIMIPMGCFLPSSPLVSRYKRHIWDDFGVHLNTNPFFCCKRIFIRTSPRNFATSVSAETCSGSPGTHPLVAGIQGARWPTEQFIDRLSHKAGRNFTCDFYIWWISNGHWANEISPIEMTNVNFSHIFFYTWPEPSNMCLNCRIVECNEDFNYTIRGYNLILLIYLDDRMWRVG